MRLQLRRGLRGLGLALALAPAVARADEATDAAAPGWKDPVAYQEASAGLAADLAGNLDQCIEHDTRSLAIEEHPRTRLHLASCQTRAGRLLDALASAQRALKLGIERRDAGVMKAARERVERLVPKIPKVAFSPPDGVTELQISFDNHPVPTDALKKTFTVDPGKHTVHAEGVQGGVPVSFDREIHVREGETLSVPIALRPAGSEFLTPGQLKCMLAAKSKEDVVHCMGQPRQALVIKAGFALGAYSDTNHVDVVTPQLDVTVASPTGGWHAGGSVLVDVLSAASPDIVSMASPRYHETRYAGSVAGGYKPGVFGVTGNAFASSEPDYRSLGGGVAATLDLRDKTFTPRVGYGYSHDTIGRGGTPFDVFSRTLDAHELEAGATFILTPSSLLLLSATAKLERGDQSKPYRYVPMFDSQVYGPYIPAGANVALVNRVRLPVRPLEQLPTERNRYALGARFVRRMGQSATLRLEQRLYVDTWLTKATTTDARYVLDLSRHFRVWPHARLHAQTGADFYRLAYFATLDQGTFVLPTYRTGDRELGPLVTVTGGGGTRILLSGPESKTLWGLNLSGDIMYSRFFESLFVRQRTAFYGSIGVDAEFD